MDMSIAKFALKLQSKHKLSQVATYDIIDSVSWLIKHVNPRDKQLQANNVIEHLAKFSTEKRRESFYHNNCNYIPPQKVAMGVYTYRRSVQWQIGPPEKCNFGPTFWTYRSAENKPPKNFWVSRNGNFSNIRYSFGNIYCSLKTLF